MAYYSAHGYETRPNSPAPSTSASSPRSSDSSNVLPPETIIDILGSSGPLSLSGSSDRNRAESYAGTASSLAGDEDSEEYESGAESSGRVLQFTRLNRGSSARLADHELGSHSLSRGATFASRLSSRAASPTPTRPASPVASTSATGSALHHHIHHHYHHSALGASPSTSALGSSSRRPSSNNLKKASAAAAAGLSSAASSAEHVPDYFAAENYRTSNLARKLGFASPDVNPHYKKRFAKTGWFGSNSRTRDSKRDAPPSYSRIHGDTISLLGVDGQSPLGSPSMLLSSSNSGSVPSWYYRSWLGQVIARILRQPFVPTQPVTILFTLVLVASFIFSTTTFTMHALNNDKAPLPWRSFCQDQRPFPHDLADSLAPVNVFVGVFSVDAAYERRHLIRSTYVRHSKPIDPRTGKPANNIQFKFILGRPRQHHARRVALEMETYNDVVVLDLKENMNKGKTHAFFQWANENATIPVFYHSPSRQQEIGVAFKKADYVVKADDDAFLVLSELERHLRVSPREQTYWGYLIRNLFMGGEAYALSSDLVNYVATHEPLLPFVNGAEDKKVARWLRMHPNASSINWVTERCWIYDHPKASTTYSHGFLFPDQVERIRMEGRRGLSPEERLRRGGDWAQSWSSVSQWKSQYTVPSQEMTMEEEVEALIEGGGRWGPEDAWKQALVPKVEYIDWHKVRFSAADQRVHERPIAQGLPSGIRPAWSGDLPNSNGSPASRYNRIPNDFIRDVEEPILPVHAGDATRNFANATVPSPSSDVPIPRQHHAQMPAIIPDIERLVPPPTLRYEPERMTAHERRMLGLPYGGTVVVHYLKRNEWFLETALALLGRHRTWDSGVEALAYTHTPLIGALDQQDVVVSKSALWSGRGSVQLADAYWGSARMFGSPIVRSDGYISEGRESAFERVAKLPVGPISGRLGRLIGRPKKGYADPDEVILPSSTTAQQQESSTVSLSLPSPDSTVSEDGSSAGNSKATEPADIRTSTAAPKFGVQQPWHP